MPIESNAHLLGNAGPDQFDQLLSRRREQSQAAAQASAALALARSQEKMFEKELAFRDRQMRSGERAALLQQRHEQQLQSGALSAQEKMQGAQLGTQERINTAQLAAQERMATEANATQMSLGKLNKEAQENLVTLQGQIAERLQNARQAYEAAVRAEDHVRAKEAWGLYLQEQNRARAFDAAQSILAKRIMEVSIRDRAEYDLRMKQYEEEKAARKAKQDEYDTLRKKASENLRRDLGAAIGYTPLMPEEGQAEVEATRTGFRETAVKHALEAKAENIPSLLSSLVETGLSRDEARRIHDELLLRAKGVGSSTITADEITKYGKALSKVLYALDDMGDTTWETVQKMVGIATMTNPFLLPVTGPSVAASGHPSGLSTRSSSGAMAEAWKVILRDELERVKQQLGPGGIFYELPPPKGRAWRDADEYLDAYLRQRGVQAPSGTAPTAPTYTPSKEVNEAYGALLTMAAGDDPQAQANVKHTLRILGLNIP